MIGIRSSKHTHWRNVYAEHPVFVVELELSGMADWRAGALGDDLQSILHDRFPRLREGFAGLDAAGLVARLALEFQRLGDPVPDICGARPVGENGTQATAYFAYRDQQLAPASAKLAVNISNMLTENPPAAELTAALDRAADAVAAAGLDRSTRAMAAAAARRGIPWVRPLPTLHILLGQGHKRRYIYKTVQGADSAIGIELSRNKVLTLMTLHNICLPVGRFAAINRIESADKTAAQIGYPVVLKPVAGMKGRNVFVGLQNAAELSDALKKANARPGDYMLQSLLPGADHRMLVVSGRLVAVARREPASVVADGKRTVAELVKLANQDPRRGDGNSKIMNRIRIDDEVRRILAAQSLNLDAVPAEGTQVYLRRTANISTGGTAVDVTDSVHPDNRSAAEKAAKALGMQVCGVDFISPDISRSWREVGGGICELNAAVGLRPHWIANPARDVTGPIVDSLVPPGDDGRIPTAMVTGTKGKSTTTMMLSGILALAGHTVGTATTDGIRVGGETLAAGDLAGSGGASIAMSDPTVTAAALEVARGGLILAGMHLDRCDVAALLNVDREQIGIDGIETLDDMARLKGKVLDAATRAVVLNADDPRCAALAGKYPALRKFLFSINEDGTAVRARIPQTDVALFLRGKGSGEEIVISEDGKETPLLPVSGIPSAVNGIVRFNIANAMAAAALALGLDVPLDLIREGLRCYDNSMENAVGRFSFVDGFPMPIVFDRAAQPPALVSAATALRQFPVSGRRLCAVTTAGNRPGWHFAESAAAIARDFDFFVCYERTELLRGRKPGEIAALFRDGLAAAGVDGARVATAPSNKDAAAIIAAEAQPGDLVAVFCSDVPNSVGEYRAAFAQSKQRVSG
jgi:cyanophycin synthetase